MSRPTIQERFDEFHAANPTVLVELRKLALDLVRAGHTKVGIKMCWEVLRWHFLLRPTDETSEFRLDNSYTAHYARLLMDTTPELVGVFETREMTARAPIPEAPEYVYEPGAGQGMLA